MAKFCTNCGASIEKNQEKCLICGKQLVYHHEPINKSSSINNESKQPKSKLVAGLFGIFFGFLGVHNFYLGYNTKAWIQLCLTLIGFCGVGTIISFIWGFVEGIMILAGSIKKDAYGNDLVS